MQPKTIYLIMMVLIYAPSLLGQQKQKKYDFAFNIDLGFDNILFFQEAAYQDQLQWYPSVYAKPKFNINWNESKSNITFEGFVRADINGDSRTHWDVRELYYQYYKNNFDFSIGLKKIFWGKTEGVHLVDVINQVDFLEGADGEEKLGQPMLQLSYSSKLGTFTGFALPYTRQIVFGNEAGRPRTPSIITADKVTFESEMDEWQPTFALRWAHFIGDADIGLHYFYGNAREPLILFSPQGEFSLQYPVVHQVGIDYQHIVKNVLFKIESIYRSGNFDDIFAITGGVEYTFGNINKKGLDIGVLAEYVYDNRGVNIFSSLNNDVFVATRLAFNNVTGIEILYGVFQDISKSTMLMRLEGSTRIGENFKITATGQGFFKVDETELVYLFRKDSFFELACIRYF